MNDEVPQLGGHHSRPTIVSVFCFDFAVEPHLSRLQCERVQSGVKCIPEVLVMDHVVVFVLGVLGLRRRLEAPKDRSSNSFISGRSERFSGMD